MVVLVISNIKLQQGNQIILRWSARFPVAVEGLEVLWTHGIPLVTVNITECIQTNHQKCVLSKLISSNTLKLVL